MITKRTALGAVVSALAGALVSGAVATEASAQAYPTKPVRVIVPFGAGSATDIVPRIVLEHVGKEIGQSFIIENRGGAGGTLGTAAVAKAEPDGYTLLATSSAHAITPSVYANLPYKAAQDFTAIAPFGELPSVLITAPSKGLKTIKDFVDAAKAKPGTFTFASVGVGSATHLMGERFRLAAGFDATHVPFRGGPEALTEVIAGRVDFYMCPVNTALPYIREGKLLGLVAASPKRASALPDVPTSLESGYPESDFTVWLGMFAPAGTPREIVDRLNAEINKALKVPAVREKLSKAGLDPIEMTPAAFDARAKKEIEQNAAIAKAAGIKGN